VLRRNSIQDGTSSRTDECYAAATAADADADVGQ